MVLSDTPIEKGSFMVLSYKPYKYIWFYSWFQLIDKLNKVLSMVLSYKPNKYIWFFSWFQLIDKLNKVLSMVLTDKPMSKFLYIQFQQRNQLNKFLPIDQRTAKAYCIFDVCTVLLEYNLTSFISKLSVHSSQIAWGRQLNTSQHRMRLKCRFEGQI